MYKSAGGSLNRGEESKTSWSEWQLISLQVALEGWCHPPAGRNLANGWPQCRCRNQKICQQGLDLLVSGIYRISDDQGQLPEGASREECSTEYTHYSLARSGLGLICCNLVSDVDEQIIFCRIGFASSPSLLTSSHCTHHSYCSHNLRTMSQRYSLRQTPR